MSGTLRASLLAAALCATLTACGGGGGGNVATVNGTPITRADLDKKLESSAQAKQQFTQMVQSDLIDQYAKDKNVTVSDDEIAKKEDEIKARYPAGQFENILKQQGLTEADVHGILKQQIVLQKAVAPQVHVADADVKAYFDKNRATFDKPEQVQARHILVADLKTAGEVLAKVKAPNADWNALAKQYSTDPSSKDKGGELGFFGKGQMVPAFQEAAFNAKVGQIVGPVKSPFGYHIIQVEAKKPATHATFASTQAQIRDQLTQQQDQQQIPVFLNTLRSTAKIDISDPRFADAFPSPAPSLAPAAPASAAPAAPAPAKS